MADHSQSQDRIVVQPLPSSTPPARAGREPRLRHGLVGLALALLLVLAVGVFVYLPRWVESPAPAPDPAPAAENVPASQAKPPPESPAPSEIDYLELARQMDQAEQTRAAYEALFDSFERRGAQEWAGDAFASARTSAQQALERFEAREFSAAEAHYRAALSDLRRVQEAAQALLRQQLAAGARALEQGESAAARAAFEFALRIDPEHAGAARGVQRAATLDRAFALLEAGRESERAGELAAAARSYREALAVDPDMVAASEGLGRMQARIGAEQFAQALSQGLSALAHEEPARARAAFERAERLRPGTAQVRAGLTRVAELELQQRVLKLRERAEALESEERWDEALAQHAAALQLDPTLVFALEGRARTQPRVQLNKQFNELLGQPERLLSPAVREQAQALLAAARQIVSAGPVLSRQIESLAAELTRAQTPVSVALRSDNQTRVIIHRVAQLGAFSQRELKLLPGRYVAVGTRAGYRDVRKEFTVRPGESPPLLTVQCEEPI